VTSVGLVTLPVREVIRATPRTRILRVDLGASGFRYVAGQAVMAGLHDSPLRKPYSIASAPDESTRTGYLELLVQVDDSGSPDPHLELAAPGTPLDIEGPFGQFGLPASADGGLLMVAGGTGIAPLRSMLLQALSQPDCPPVHVVFSARSADELAYRDELERLAADRRVRLWSTVTRRHDPPWTGRRGRVDRVLLAEALPSPGCACLVCGPPAFVADVRAGLLALGVPEARIGVERYAE
jgi:CDP-4-dehydro-6-deoxyglucose reductase